MYEKLQVAGWRGRGDRFRNFERRGEITKSL